MENTLKIGLITKPHGVRGEMRVTPLTDDASRFKRLKNVMIDGVSFKIANVKIATDAVYLSVIGVEDRNSAESFRGKFLCVKREDAEPLTEFSYYITDIIGCNVVTETGDTICVITEVTSAKTDIFTGRTEKGKIVRFPFLRDYLVKVDTEKKTIVVKGKRFSEVCLYEN